MSLDLELLVYADSTRNARAARQGQPADPKYGRYYRRNPEKARAWRAKFRLENPEYFRAYGRRRYRAFMEFLNEAKGEPCADCETRFPPECMDFDHVRGTKAFLLSDGMNHSPAVLKREIAKCDVVCANCHRIRTRKRREALVAV